MEEKMTLGQKLKVLLKEDCEEKNVSAEKALPDSGYYVSREMLDGYLSYSRRNVKRITAGISLFILSNVFDCFEHNSMIMSVLYWLTMTAGIIIIIWQFFQTKQYQEIRTEHLTFDEKVFEEFKRQRESRRKKYAVVMIVGVMILLTSTEIEHFLMIHVGQTVCNVFGWIADTVWLGLVIWSGMSMHADSIVIKNAQHPPKSSQAKRYRWVYAALPVTVMAVLIGMITNAWSPYAPVIILFCCLLVTTCKLLIESREER